MKKSLVGKVCAAACPWLFALAGCSGGVWAGPAVHTGPDPMMEAHPEGPLQPQGSVAMSWPGTWNVRLSYKLDCVWGGSARQHGENSHTVTLEVQPGSGGTSLAAAAGADFELTGTGSDTGLTLSGSLPLKDFQSSPVSGGRGNSVTLTADSITDPRHASGKVEGTFQTANGFRCTVNEGVAEFSR